MEVVTPRGTITSSEGILPEASPPIVIHRSTSLSAVAGEFLSKLKRQVSVHPRRSRSAVQATQKQTRDLTSMNHEHTSQDAVALYYAARTNEMAVELEGHGLVQITNSQRLRRGASFQVRITSMRVRSLQNVEICRTLTVKRAESVLKALPFSNLLRSDSLEATGASQSLQILQKERAELNKTARFGRRFHGGKISASFKNRMVRAAYPDLKCAYCTQIFGVNDRKRNYARHCRTVHRTSLRDIQHKNSTAQSEKDAGPRLAQQYIVSDQRSFIVELEAPHGICELEASSQWIFELENPMSLPSGLRSTAPTTTSLPFASDIAVHMNDSPWNLPEDSRWNP
jgi:hypothetical protein